MLDVDDPELMHFPGRADQLEDMEDHVNSVACLTRALWMMAHSEELNTQDKRNRDALIAVADAAADHASAARYLFYRRNQR
jgi:hypothetical protein